MTLKFFSTTIKLVITSVVVVLYIHYFFPQSWGYFTIEPRQPIINVYAVRGGTVSTTSFIATNMSYGMGVSRKGKILFNELRRLLNANKNMAWKPLNKASISSITQRENYNIITTGNKSNLFYGKFLIIKSDRPSGTILKNHRKFIPKEQYILAEIKR